MIETWTRWKPENVKVPIKCYLSNFLDENNILSFSIEPYREEKEWNENERTKNKIVKVSFNQNIPSYRCTQESITLRTLYELSDLYGDEFYTQWSLFKIKNSPYFEYISSLSDKPLDPQKYTHYAFYCVYELFEVIADHEPSFELID